LGGGEIKKRSKNLAQTINNKWATFKVYLSIETLADETEYKRCGSIANRAGHKNK
jgi:hypothetical protein